MKNISCRTLSLLPLLALAGCGMAVGPVADVRVSPDGEVRTPAAALEKVRSLRAAGKIAPGRRAPEKTIIQKDTRLLIFTAVCAC